VNTADSEPPLITVMITLLADDDPTTSVNIGAPLLFNQAKTRNLFSLGQRDYSAGAMPPSTNIDTAKLADDDPRMASVTDDYLSIPSWSNWSKKLSNNLDIFKFAEVRDENTIHTTQWSVTCDRRSTRLRVATFIRDRTYRHL
jgi:hypothetical protein